jgi:hypothetical protein
MNATADKLSFEMNYVDKVVSKDKETTIQTVEYYNPEKHVVKQFDTLEINQDERQPAYKNGVEAPYYPENKDN